MFELTPPVLAQLKTLCREYGVRRLALFGSATRSDFTPESDLDVLVEFVPGTRTGLRLFELEASLADLLGRRVDLSTPGFLGVSFRDRVLREARNLYVAA